MSDDQPCLSEPKYRRSKGQLVQFRNFFSEIRQCFIRMFKNLGPKAFQG